MAKSCKIICAKCGKPILYDYRDIAYYSENDTAARVSVPCTRKGCKHRNTSRLFDEIFSTGQSIGKFDAKKEIRKFLGIERG